MTRAATDEILPPPGESRLLSTSKILVRALRYVPPPHHARLFHDKSENFLPKPVIFSSQQKKAIAH